MIVNLESPYATLGVVIFLLIAITVAALCYDPNADDDDDGDWR